MKKFLNITFFVVALLTIFEFVFIQGMFTSFIVMGASGIVGLVNAIYALKEKKWNEAGLYAIATIALNMGYFIIMIQYE